MFEYTIREVPRILKDYIARENKKIGEYDYYVVTDDLEEAVADVAAVVRAESRRVPGKVKPIIRDYEEEDN